MAIFSVSGRTSHPFSIGAPREAGRHRGTSMSYKVTAMLTKQHAKKNTSPVQLCRPRKGDTPVGSGQQQKPRESLGVCMTGVQSEVNKHSCCYVVTLQASLVAV